MLVFQFRIFQNLLYDDNSRSFFFRQVIEPIVSILELPDHTLCLVSQFTLSIEHCDAFCHG